MRFVRGLGSFLFLGFPVERGAKGALFVFVFCEVLLMAGAFFAPLGWVSCGGFLLVCFRGVVFYGKHSKTCC